MSTGINGLLATRAGFDAFGRPRAADAGAYERAKAAFNQEARDNWHNEKWHREQADILSTRLDYGFRFDSLFPSYFETKVVGEFDTEEIVERRGLQVFWTARGGYVDETQLTTERWTIPRDSVGFHLSEFEGKLRANYAETLEALADLGQQRLEAEINRRMFQMLQTAIPSTSPYYVNATSGLTTDDLNTALREVNDAIRPNNGVIPPVTILGRATMIDKISDLVTDAAALNDPEATAEVRRRGRIGVYRGANVVRLQNYTDENDQPYIPDNELWVFGGTVGKFVQYGPPRTNSWRENTVEYRHWQTRLDIGGLVAYPQYARRIVASV